MTGGHRAWPVVAGAVPCVCLGGGLRKEKRHASAPALIGPYLAAIVAANLIVNEVGPKATIYVAFALIGIDLTVRDFLHREWEDRNLWPRMAALVLAGGVISFVLGAEAVAVASCVAFVAAGLADTLVFQLMRRVADSYRVNASNVVAAAVDSLLFPTLAFGGVMWGVTFGQFVAKVAGGALWLLLLRAALRRRALA